MINENRESNFQNNNFKILNNNENNIPFQNNPNLLLHEEKNNKFENNSIFQTNCKFILNRKTKNLNPFQINCTNIINSNDKANEIKRKNRLKKNAECARKSRERKKILMNNLIEENMRLKLENKELKKIINSRFCSKCGKEILNESNKYMIDNSNLNQNKKKIFVLSTFLILTILLLIFHINPITSKLRNLNLVSEEIPNFKYSNLEIENFTLTSIHISYGDYYSLVKRNKFLQSKYTYINKGKIRLIKERDLTNDIEPENCENCIIKLEQNNITFKKSKFKGIHFKIIMIPKIININGTDIKINSGKNGEPISIYEIDCNVFGFSQHMLYKKEIN